MPVCHSCFDWDGLQLRADEFTYSIKRPNDVRGYEEWYLLFARGVVFGIDLTELEMAEECLNWRGGKTVGPRVDDWQP